MLSHKQRPVKANSRSLLINLSLLIISSLFTVLLSEAALRLMGWNPLYVSPERDQFWKYDALLGWAHQPGQEGIFATPQFRTQVRINQQGLRDREHSYERPDGATRILVLGDSFAWGYGVEESERFSQLLEPMLEVEVINAGVSGYSTDQELLWLRDEGIKYDFDLVILVFAGNDIGDNKRDLVNTIYFKPRFVRTDGQLVVTGTPVAQTSTLGRSVYSLSQRSALAYFLVQRYFDLLSVYRDIRDNSENVNDTLSATNLPGEPFEPTLALFDEIRSIASTAQAPLMIVATDRWWNGSAGETYSGFIDTLQADGFLVLDVEAMPEFDAADMLIPNDGHWSRIGHEFVAHQIADLIERNQLLAQP